MPAPINHVCDLNVFIEGTPFDGHAVNVEFEPIEFNKTEEARLGIMGTPKLFAGFDPLIVTITWASLMSEWAIVTANPLQAFAMQLRGSISSHDGTGLVDERPYIVEFAGISDVHGPGSFENKETAEYETTFSCTTARQIIDGTEIFNFDLYGYIYTVNGEDLLQGRRANLGIG